MPGDSESDEAGEESQEVSDAQKWALIFNTFGQERLLDVLWDATGRLIGDDTADRHVVEFRRGVALPITEHVESLEDQQQVDRPEPESLQ